MTDNGYLYKYFLEKSAQDNESKKAKDKYLLSEEPKEEPKEDKKHE